MLKLFGVAILALSLTISAGAFAAPQQHSNHARDTEDMTGGKCTFSNLARHDVDIHDPNKPCPPDAYKKNKN